MTRTAEVEAEYRNTFEEFSRKAEYVQSLASRQNAEQRNIDRKAFETALLELEKAHVAYNQARDAFLGSFLPQSLQVGALDEQNHASDVPAIAELIWESAGRPDGTAEDDWRRAEAIVKCAITTAD